MMLMYYYPSHTMLLINILLLEIIIMEPKEEIINIDSCEEEDPDSEKQVVPTTVPNATINPPPSD